MTPNRKAAMRRSQKLLELTCANCGHLSHGDTDCPPFEMDLCFNDWAGFRRVRVLVVGETPKRYRIEALQRMRLAGRNRCLDKGERALVPRTAVRRPIVS
jgi:RNA polymerase subunit RPABC4/transcription elongation factor Spt4